MVNEYRFTTEKNDVRPLTEFAEQAVAESGVTEGMCIIQVPHTTAGLCITSKWDETDFADIKGEFRRIVPTRVDFCHQFDTPEDAAGHIKSILAGSTLAVIVKDGKLLLGSSQGIYFLEFDGPRDRMCYVKVFAC